MERKIYNFITTKPKGFIPSIFRLLLMPISWLYATVIWGRNFCYTSNIIRQKRLPCTVISVGNIVVGGTGKTPTVAAIAKLIQKSGLHVSVLLRGYKRQGSDAVVVVSDGKKLLCSREDSGDEAEMLARQLPDIPIVVGKKRFLSGITALKNFNSDVLILDDGFQHRQLARDLDILTIDATKPYGTNALLPVGTMREPKPAIKRADIIILTRTDATDTNIIDLKAKLNRFAQNKPILESIHQPKSLYRINNHENHTHTMSLDMLTDKRLLAVCGIGNPDAFIATLEKFKPEKIELLAFPDHYVYTEKDLHQIQQQITLCQAEWVITTQKDEQKLSIFSTHTPIVVLAIELVITNGEETLNEVLQILK